MMATSTALTIATPESATSELDPRAPVILQAGERRFKTRPEILMAESDHFNAFFKHSWRETQPDGSYFIDIDGDTFEHVLRYLRTSIFPLFYDSFKGHDYAMYHALLQQADYLLMPKLKKWLEDKTYLNAIKIYREIDIISDDFLEITQLNTSAQTNIDFCTAWETKKVYICPRNIPVHRGKPELCGKACHKMLDGGKPDYDDELQLKLFIVKKTAIFNQNMCEPTS